MDADMTRDVDAGAVELDIEPIRALFDERNRTWIARKAHGSTGDKRLLKDAKQRLRTQSLMLNAEVPKLLAEIERLRALLRSPQPQAVKVPSVAGWYWARPERSKKFVMVNVSKGISDDKLYVRHVSACRSLPLGTLTDWHGPLAAPQAPEGT